MEIGLGDGARILALARAEGRRLAARSAYRLDAEELAGAAVLGLVERLTAGGPVESRLARTIARRRAIDAAREVLGDAQRNPHQAEARQHTQAIGEAMHAPRFAPPDIGADLLRAARLAGPAALQAAALTTDRDCATRARDLGRVRYAILERQRILREHNH